MLGKLMKYEFRATSRTFLPMFGALIVVSLVNRIFDKLGMGVPRGIGIAISVILMCAICAATLIITLQRFSKTLLQSEGYLTMTLPVKTESVILSKLFVSTVWQIASFIVVVIAILLLTITNVQWSDITRFFRELFNLSLLDTSRLLLLILEAVVAVMLSIFASTLLIYSCLSLGMLVNNRRGLASFVAFLVITTVIQIIGSIGVGIVYATNLWDIFTGWSNFALSQLFMFLLIAQGLVGTAVFFLLTRYMLKNRLNLQ